MRPENEIAPEIGGSQGANEKQINVTGNDYAVLGASAPDDYRDPTDLHLRTLPTITALPGHGHHHPREGFEHFSESEFESAVNGFVLGDVVFAEYAKASTLQGRYEAIFDGIEMGFTMEAKRTGTKHGFVAYLVAVIEGYAALAQSAPSAMESLQ